MESFDWAALERHDLNEEKAASKDWSENHLDDQLRAMMSRDDGTNERAQQWGRCTK